MFLQEGAEAKKQKLEAFLLIKKLLQKTCRIKSAVVSAES